MKRSLLLAAIAAAVVGSHAHADTVLLTNGDKLTGTIGLVTAKEVKFKSPAFGGVTIPQSQITSYTIDQPVRVQPKAAPALTAPVSGDPSGVKVGETRYDFTQLKAVNPPKQEWKGAIVANLSLARGNTNKFVIGVDADAELRRDDDANNDRTTLGAGYNYGTSGGGPGGEPSTTDTDNWNVLGQYDRFWTEKLYGYTSLKIEHDRIAELYYRVAPGVGLGYQWIETPRMTFSTEAGISYIREKFTEGDSEDNIALRLAYAYDHKLSDSVTLFHTLEYLPAFSDPSDFILNTDLGIRAKLTDNFFSQFKVLYKRDSTPADGALKNDLLYTIGVGWEF